MLQTEPLTRSRVLDVLADRLRDAFKQTLHALYVLPDNPYEPAGDNGWIVLAAVVDDASDSPTERSRKASNVGSAFEQDVNWRYVVTVFTLSPTELRDEETDVARSVLREGVQL